MTLPSRDKVAVVPAPRVLSDLGQQPLEIFELRRIRRRVAVAGREALGALPGGRPEERDLE